jgi:ABC-type glycerol-3-phosphate transport system substrate-binding protein
MAAAGECWARSSRSPRNTRACRSIVDDKAMDLMSVPAGVMLIDNTRANDIFGQSVFELLGSNALAVMGYASDTFDLRIINSCAVELGGDYFPVKNFYIPNGIIGINKALNETELAKDFIHYLFSEENQFVNVKDGFPTNTKAFDSWMSEEEKNKSVLYISNTDDEGISHDIQSENLTLEQTNVISSMIKQLTTPLNNNAYVMDMITEEALPYFTGEKDLDTVCQNIVNKVNLYLSE